MRLAASLLLLTAITASAQVEVSIVPDRQNYLLFENIPITVKIVNQTGDALDMQRMAGDTPWLDFYVNIPDGTEIKKTANPVPPPPLILSPAEVKPVTVDILPNFRIRDTGEFEIVAEVHHKGKTYTSKTFRITIEKGSVIWTQPFTLAGDTAETPNRRVYTLLLHNQKDQRLLFFRMQDPGFSTVLTTAPLGPIVNFGEPQTRIDPEGGFHVLHQSGTRNFTYNHFDATGKKVATRFFSNLGSSPNIIRTEKNETLVVGGEELFDSGKSNPPPPYRSPFNP